MPELNPWSLLVAAVSAGLTFAYDWARHRHLADKANEEARMLRAELAAIKEKHQQEIARLDARHTEELQKLAATFHHEEGRVAQLLQDLRRK